MSATITSTVAIEFFDGNGSTLTPYPTSIQRSSDDDLYLLVGGEPETGFTVANDGIRTTVAVPPGTQVVLYRATPRTQENQFPSNTTPAPEDVAAALNKLTLITQELSRLSAGGGRTISFPINEPDALTNVLPIAGDRVNTVIYFDATTGEMTTITINELLLLLGGAGFANGDNAGDMKYWDGTAWINLAAPAAPGGNQQNILTHSGTAPSWITVDEVVLGYCDAGTPATGTFLKF